MKHGITRKSFNIDFNNYFVTEAEVTHSSEVCHGLGAVEIRGKRNIKVAFLTESLALSGLTPLTEYLGDTKGKAFKVTIETL